MKLLLLVLVQALNICVSSNETNYTDTVSEIVERVSTEEHLGSTVTEGITLIDASINSTETKGQLLNNTNTDEATNGTTTTSSTLKTKYKCFLKNITQFPVSSVKIVNASDLMSILSTSINITEDEDSYCALVLFYAKWCHFSMKFAPHYNALGRLFPHLDVLAIDASTHYSLSARFGVVGVPTVIFFSNKRPVGKLNDSQSNLHDLAIFIKHHAEIEAVNEAEVTEEDFEGPIKCFVDEQPDYVLWLAWTFLTSFFAYLFLKSSLFNWIVDSIQVNWQEAEAQHDHID